MDHPRGNPWKRLPRGVLIAPSLLACDFPRMGQPVDQAILAGADVLHMDVMDGHFVPNLSMGPAVVKALRRYTDHPLDVHLMVTDPGHFLEKFAEAGADSITFHIEACGRPRSIRSVTPEEGRAGAEPARKMIERLHSLGLGAGITLRPGTPAEAIGAVAPNVDLVLVMTVEPGYGGQKFMPDMMDKIAAIRAMLRDEQRLEVDGGINPATAPLCVARGADVLVAGVDIFGSADIPRAVRDLRDAADRARA